MAITDLQAARQMAEQHPDLHESRQIAFGQNYLQDLEEGKGTAQYYTGFGLAPDWVTGAIGAPATTPIVQEPTAGDAQVAEQIAAQDRDAGITGASAIQPTISDPFLASGAAGGARLPPMDQAGAIAAMTPNQAYAIPGQMPKTPAEGMVWGPQEQFQPETSDPFLMSGAAGDARLPQIGYGEGEVDPKLAAAAGLTTDYPEAAQQDPTFWENAKNDFLATGKDIGNIFTGLKQQGIDLSKMAGSAIMNMIAPGLGLITQLPISSASGEQQDLVRDQLVDSGVVLDDIGRIVQQPGLDYNTPENVMAGYTPGQTGLQIGDLKIGGGTVQHSAAERINDIQNTIDNLDNQWSQLKASDPEAFEAKKQNLKDRQEALKEFINMGAAEAAGGVRLEDWDPENKIAGEVVYGTDYFPDLGQEDTAPVTIEKTYKEKAEEAWKDIKTIDTIAGNTIYGNENIGFFPSPGEAQAALEAYAAEADQAEAGTETAVTGIEGPPSEIYRDPILDMEPAESVDLGNPLSDSRIVPEEYETEGAPWTGYQDPIMDMAAEQEAAAAVEAAIQEQTSQALGAALHGEGGGGVSYGGRDESANVEAASGDVYGGAAYGYNEAAEKGNQGGGGGGKIVCTMMNESYGFGSFRNKIWLRHSKDLAPEYQIGYHKIFLPLVRLSKKNKLLKKTLEHIAVHRTIDIRQEARGKVHLLGRVYRKILEPTCYWVGKYAKK